MPMIQILAAALLVQSPAPGQSTFEIRPLAPRGHAALVVLRPPHYAFASSLVVVGDSGVLIVDTQQSPAAARDLVRALPSITDRPVRWIVNTHWHPDHVFGNGAWKDAFPAARIIGHRSLLHDVPGRAAAMRDQDLADLPPSIELRRRWLAEGHRDGAPLDSAARADLEYSLRLRQDQLAQLRDLRILAPDSTFSDSITLDLGGIATRLIHVGPAHTAGDVVVHVPGAGVLAVGDLLERGAPWLDGACPGGWARALRRLMDLEATTILMSHGPIAGPAFLDLYARLMDAIANGRDLAPFGPRAAELGLSPEAFDRFAAAAPALVAAADSTGACDRPRD